MARNSNETTSDMYIRLGLSLDELQSGFVDAQRTIQDNMGRLWRENTIIDLQMQVDLAGLDEVADADRILQIRTDALNQQLERQRSRLQLANAELRDITESTGENSIQTQRARIAFERERLAVAQLEEQLRNLNQTQDEAVDGTGDFMGNVSELTDRFAPMAAVLGTVMMATTELVEKFKELQTQSFELNLPFQDTKNLLRQLKLAGGDIGDFEGYIRGITDAYVKGEFDDPEFLALNKYGAKITDVNGRLKDFAAITEEVYQAYLKAKAAGEEIEFLQLTGGESGIRDAIQFFERYAEAKEDAAKIYDSGIDPKELHETERALNLVTEQLGELKDAVVSVFTPQVTATLKDFFEIIHAGTQFIVEHKDALQTLINMAPAVKINNMWHDLLETSNALKETSSSWADFKRMQDHAPLDDNPLSQYSLQRIKDFRDELAELRIELDYADSDYEQAKAKLDLWRKNELTDKLFVSSDERLAIEELYSAKLEQIEQERADKLTAIRESVAAAEQSDLEKKLAAIEKEKDAWRAAGMEEEEVVELSQQRINQVLAAAQEEQLRQRQAAIQKAQDLMQATVDLEYSLTHDAFEKQLYDIERWKQAQIEKSDLAEQVAATIANAAMREADAFEREIDRIQGRIESAQDRLARLTLSQYDNDIRNAFKQFQRDIEDNVPRDLAQAIFDASIKQARRRAAEDSTGHYVQTPPEGRSHETRALIDFDARQRAFETTIARASQFSSDTIKQALDKVKAIEALRPADPVPQSRTPTPSGFDIVYGDLADSSPLTSSRRSFDISYGDSDADSDAVSSIYDTQVSQALADAANTFFANTQQISQSLTDITRNAADSVSTTSTPSNTTVAPQVSVNIDLGGAYVFDDAMKQQLTDDITQQVADAVTDAVSKATSQTDMSYRR